MKRKSTTLPSLMPALKNEKESTTDREVKRIMRKLRKQVEQKNRTFSPELIKLGRYFFLCCVMMMIFFGMSFWISEVSFNNYSDSLNYIGKFTDIQCYSILLSFFTRYMEAARLGLSTIDDVATILNEAQYASDKLKNLISDLSSQISVTNQDNSDIDVLNIDPKRGYYIQRTKAINSLTLQVSYINYLISGTIDYWDVEKVPQAYWVFKNGMDSIADSLDLLSTIFINKATDERNIARQYAIWIAVGECILIFLMFFISIPLFFKSEKIHFDVVGVFFGMDPNMVNYLQEDAKNKLDMRKDKLYPECRGRYKTEENI